MLLQRYVSVSTQFCPSHFNLVLTQLLSYYFYEYSFYFYYYYFYYYHYFYYLQEKKKRNIFLHSLTSRCSLLLPTFSPFFIKHAHHRSFPHYFSIKQPILCPSLPITHNFRKDTPNPL